MNPTRVVVLAWGNPSRGDDALGPEFLRAAAPRVAALAGDFNFVEDFQLQPEHATDLDGCDLALFVDARRTPGPPVTLAEVRPQRDATFTTHGMSAAAVLAAYAAAFGRDPPPAFQLAMRGERFRLGDPMTPAAQSALAAALVLFDRLAVAPTAAAWRGLAAEGAARAACAPTQPRAS
jgi:hydrogenase maturation protease